MDDTGGQQPYQPVACLNWSAAEVKGGTTLKVRGMPKDCQSKFFRVLVPTRRTDYLLPDEVRRREAAAARTKNGFHWVIEQYHRVLKQLTGVRACQGRLAPSQRNHIALAVRARTRLKQAAHDTQQTAS